MVLLRSRKTYLLVALKKKSIFKPAAWKSLAKSLKQSGLGDWWTTNDTFSKSCKIKNLPETALSCQHHPIIYSTYKTMGNYRQISLTIIPYKLVELLVYNEILEDKVIWS